MKKIILVCFLLTCLLPSFPALAQTDEPAIPPYMKLLDCGNDFQIYLISRPEISGSQSGLIADNDLKYLTIRLGIKYSGTEVWQGFEPDSFRVTEFYKGQAYTEYVLDGVISGLIESDWSSPAFFAPITSVTPEINTILAFEVYPDVDGWNFTFSPHMRGTDNSVCQVVFRLPQASLRD